MHNLSLEATMPLLILVGVFASLMASMIGIGGGLMAIPLISLVIGYDHSLEAKLIAYSLVVGLSIFGIHKYLKQKRKPDLKSSFWILLGTLPLSIICVIFVGPEFNHVPKWIFQACYAGVVLMVIPIINLKDKIKLKKPVPTWTLPLMGMVVGALSGSFGLSGGILFVPILTIALQKPVKEVAVNSLSLKLVTSFANIIAGLASNEYQSFESHGVFWWAPLIILIGAAIGSQIGPIFNKKMSNKQTIICYNVVLGIIFVWQVTAAILMSQGIL